MRGFEHDFGERLAGVEPAAVEPDVELASVAAFDREPVDELGVNRAAEASKQRDPGGDQIAAPAQAATRALDPRATAAIEPVGRFGEQRFKPQAEADQRAAQGFERGLRLPGEFDEPAVELRRLGLKPIPSLGPAAFVARVNRGTHRAEQGFEWA